MDSKSPNYYLTHSKQLGWSEHTATIDKERGLLLKKFIAGGKILDIGCANGIYVDFLAGQGYEASGVDFVEEFINEAKKTKKGFFFLGRAEKLPFKSNEFDTVLLFDILEHGDDIKILKEAKRVAQKRILVIVPKVVDDELNNAGVVFRHYIDKSHLREYLEKDLNKLSKKAGLKISHIRPVHPLYNETIFYNLFEGNSFYKKVIRKIVFFLLPKKIYYTELFAVIEKTK